VQGVVEWNGACLLIDGHSFLSVALPCDLDQASASEPLNLLQQKIKPVVTSPQFRRSGHFRP
jgi:hypothetical protein